MLATVDDYIQAGLTHSLHTSGRKSFRGCRRRWSWVFQDFYYPRITPRPLEFGVAYHKAMEVYYEPTTWNLPRGPIANSAIQTFKSMVAAQLEQFEKNFGPADPEVLNDYQERVDLGIGMLRYHLGQLSPTLDKHIKPIKVELPFEVPIMNPATREQLWCTCLVCFDRATKWAMEQESTWRDLVGEWKGLPVTLGGRIDCLMEDELGRYWVFDWKTAARISDRTDFLLVEDQITSYLWALWLIGKLRGEEIPVAGFIYHEQKKAFPVEPEPNKTIRLGRMYSVNKQQDTSYELYRSTVEENDPDAYQSGLYDEFLEFLKESEVEDGYMTRNNFFARFNVPRNEHELMMYGQYLYDEACDMTNPDLRIYPQAGRFSCGSCAFQVPCVGKNQGEDFQYALDTLFDKKKYHYWEEAAPSTENEGRLVGA